MRTIFIVNPKAGQGKGLLELKRQIHDTALELDIEVELYETTCVLDCERYIKEVLEKEKDEVRFFVCGGDGTFNEGLNGVAGHDNASLGIYPIGTGNDFVRNFPEGGDFKSIEALLKGESKKCDAIKYTGFYDGKEDTRYCGNMFNIGFDCNVVDLTATMKTKPLIAGSFAYLVSVVVMLGKMKGANLRIEADGEELSNGEILLTSIANGSFCGGGVMSNPYSSLHDGMIDISVIWKMPRHKFITLFPKYQKGTHFGAKGIEGLIKNRKAKHVEITPLDDIMRLCTDGEIVDAKKVCFDIMPDFFNVIVPAKL